MTEKKTIASFVPSAKSESFYCSFCYNDLKLPSGDLSDDCVIFPMGKTIHEFFPETKEQNRQLEMLACTNCYKDILKNAFRNLTIKEAMTFYLDDI